MKTPYDKLPRQHKLVVDLFRKHGGALNSFVLKVDNRVVQGQVRVKELRERYGWNTPKPRGRNSDRSVTYRLYDYDIPAPVQPLNTWEKPYISYEKDGRTFYKYFDSEEEKQEYLAPKQDMLL